MKKPIPEKSKSPYGWWIATIVERYEHFDEDKTKLNRRCTAWMNTKDFPQKIGGNYI